MPVATDVRPSGVDNAFRPGNEAALTLVFPGGSLAGRTFTSTLDGLALTVAVLGDTITATAAPAVTAVMDLGSHVWLLTETTGGGSERLLIGSWTSSDGPNVTGIKTVDVLAGDVTLNVTGGPQAFAPDLAMSTPVFPGDGTVHDGIIRRTHSIQVPWAYTQTAESITDPALGTAFHVPMDVIVDNDPPGILGPQFQSGHFGPRGIVNLEGPVRYLRDMGPFGFAPVGMGDFITITNHPSGTPRALAPSWTFLSGRSVIAHGAACNLSGTDVGPSGADFVSSSVWGSMNGGHLDGSVNGVEHVDFMALFGVVGHTTIAKRVAYDVKNIATSFPAPGNPHWDLAGSVDALNFTLDEHIGLRIPVLTHGTLKLGVDSAHELLAPGMFGSRAAAGNLRLHSTLHATKGRVQLMDQVELLGEDRTFIDPARLMRFETGRVVTLNGAGPFDNEFSAFWTNGTVIYDQNASVLGAGHFFLNGVTLKNRNGEARTISAFNSLASALRYEADGATLTQTGHRGISDSPTYGVINGGVMNASGSVGALLGAVIEAGVTLADRTGVRVVDVTGAGTLTSQIGVDVPVLAKGATNIGIRNASTEVATPSVATLSAVGSTIAPNAKTKRLDNTSGGALTLSSTPTIADGQDGQILVLFNGSANSVTLTHGTANNLRLDGGTNKTLAQRASIMLMFSSTVGDWIQQTPVVTPT